MPIETRRQRRRVFPKIDSKDYSSSPTVAFSWLAAARGVALDGGDRRCQRNAPQKSAAETETELRTRCKSVPSRSQSTATASSFPGEDLHSVLSRLKADGPPKSQAAAATSLMSLLSAYTHANSRVLPSSDSVVSTPSVQTPHCSVWAPSASPSSSPSPTTSLCSEEESPQQRPPPRQKRPLASRPRAPRHAPDSPTAEAAPDRKPTVRSVRIRKRANQRDDGEGAGETGEPKSSQHEPKAKRIVKQPGPRGKAKPKPKDELKVAPPPASSVSDSNPNDGSWTTKELQLLRRALSKTPAWESDLWPKVAAEVKSKSIEQCMRQALALEESKFQSTKKKAAGGGTKDAAAPAVFKGPTKEWKLSKLIHETAFNPKRPADFFQCIDRQRPPQNFKRNVKDTAEMSEDEAIDDDGVDTSPIGASPSLPGEVSPVIDIATSSDEEGGFRQKRHTIICISDESDCSFHSARSSSHELRPSHAHGRKVKTEQRQRTTERDRQSLLSQHLPPSLLRRPSGSLPPVPRTPLITGNDTTERMSGSDALTQSPAAVAKKTAVSSPDLPPQQMLTPRHAAILDDFHTGLTPRPTDCNDENARPRMLLDAWDSLDSANDSDEAMHRETDEDYTSCLLKGLDGPRNLQKTRDVANQRKRNQRRERKKKANLLSKETRSDESMDEVLENTNRRNSVIRSGEEKDLLRWRAANDESPTARADAAAELAALDDECSDEEVAFCW